MSDSDADWKRHLKAPAAGDALHDRRPRVTSVVFATEDRAEGKVVHVQGDIPAAIKHFEELSRQADVKGHTLFFDLHFQGTEAHVHLSADFPENFDG